MATKTYTDQELQDWFYGKARTAAGYRKNVLGNNDRSRGNAFIGRLYFFSYDPKGKMTLPIYDRFPLAVPIERYSDGFLGLNLHYLSGPERIGLLKMLVQYSGSGTVNKNARMNPSYDLLQISQSLNSIARPCLKRYLFGHCRSKFIEILPNEWEMATQLPVEMFITKK